MDNGQGKEGGFSKDVILFFNSIEDQSLKDLLMTKNSEMFFEVEVGKLKTKISASSKNLFGLPEKNSIWKQRMCFNIPSIKFQDSIQLELTEEVIKEQFQLDSLKTSKEVEKQLYQSQNPMQKPCWKRPWWTMYWHKPKWRYLETLLENGWPLLKSSMLKKIEKELPNLLMNWNGHTSKTTLPKVLKSMWPKTISARLLPIESGLWNELWQNSAGYS